MSVVKLFSCSICIVFVISMACGPAFSATLQTADTQIIRHNVGTAVNQLDPALSTTLPEMNVQLQAFEGLTRVAADGTVGTGAAKAWEISDNGTRYIFRLRTAAKWSNGDPVTAYDFEYAWRRLLDPATGAYYAYRGYVIKNAEAYHTGRVTDANQLGIKALDQWTLEVVLAVPHAGFLTLVAYPPFFPVHKGIVEKHGAGWAVDPATYVGNGPYRLNSWLPNRQLELEKNPYYWDVANVQPDKLLFTLADSDATALTMWEKGQIDSTHTVPASDIQRLQQEGKLSMVSDLGVYYYVFNTQIEPFADPRVRKALTMAIDRQFLVEHVTQGGQVPAYAFVPYGIPDINNNTDFREVGGNYFVEDIAVAQALLAEAGYPDGAGFPPLTIMYSSSENHQQIAWAIAELWRQNLGIEVALVEQEWEDFLRSLKQGNYQIARIGWASDCLDAYSFLKLWLTNGESNYAFWSHKEYDRLLELGDATDETAARMEALHGAERILLQEMPVMPIYFLTRPYLQTDDIHGVARSPLGYVDFKNAWRAVK
jgi:oligopeptide transport system substrate-binding protein